MRSLRLVHQAVADALAAAQPAGRRLLATACDVGGGSASQAIPSTGAIIGAVVGGLGLLTLVLASALAASVFQIYGFSLGRLFGHPVAVGDSATDGEGGKAAGSGQSSDVLDLMGAGPTGSSPSGPSASLPSMVASQLASHELSAATESELLTDMSGVSRSAPSLALPLRDDASWRDCLIEPEQIQILRRRDGSPWCLGGGAFGTVYKALYDGVQVVAAKVITGLADERVLQDFAREAAILRDMRDRNIVQFVGVCMGREEDGHQDQAMMIQEFMEAGDLSKALRWRDQAGARVYGWHARGRRAATEVARGLHCLHKHRIVHLDMKSCNVLLTRDGTCKVGDVGLARSLATKDWLTNANTLGTFAWSAPEVLTGMQVTTAADIYSLGIVLWEIVTGEIPSRGRMRDAVVGEECPQEVVDLMDRCMAQDPAARPTAKDIVQALERMGARERAEAAQRQAEQRRRKITAEREAATRQARPAPLVRGISALRKGPFAQQAATEAAAADAAPEAAAEAEPDAAGSAGAAGSGELTATARPSPLVRSISALRRGPFAQQAAAPGAAAAAAAAGGGEPTAKARPSPLVRGISALRRGPFAQQAAPEVASTAPAAADMPEMGAEAAAAAAAAAVVVAAGEPTVQALPPPPPTSPELSVSTLAPTHSGP